MSRVILRDVAAAAGVSIFTVSIVLSGGAARAKIRPETERRVRAAARELGYVPNHAARSLRAQRTGQIGIALSEPAQWETGLNPFDGALFVGLRFAAQECDLPAFVVYPHGAGTDMSRYLDGRIDGLLVRCALRSDEPLLRLVDPVRLPVVALWRQSVPEGIGFADIDHRGGARLAVEHLIALGHSRIACFDPEIDSDDLHFDLRHQGYRDALIGAGIAMQPEWEVAESAHLLALVRQPNPVTAAFAPSDYFAESLAADVTRAGVRIPDDLSLVGFDNLSLTSVVAGGITTVTHPMQEMTIRGVRNLLALISGAPIEECRSIVPTELVVRHSTAPPASGQW